MVEKAADLAERMGSARLIWNPDLPRPFQRQARASKNTWRQTWRTGSSLHVVSARGGGGLSQKNWVEVCGPLPKTLNLFMTKIWDIPYSIYDLTKNSKPYL